VIHPKDNRNVHGITRCSSDLLVTCTDSSEAVPIYSLRLYGLTRGSCGSRLTFSNEFKLITHSFTQTVLKHETCSVSNDAQILTL